MVANARRFEEIYEEFINFIEDSVIVGHNLSFDMSFLEHKLNIMGKTLPKNDTLDTLHLAKKLYPHFPSCSLPSLRRQLCIEVKDEHRALGDVIATAELLKKILNELAKKGIKEI